MDVRRGSGHEIERSPSRLPAAAYDGCCKSPPLTRDRRIHGQWVECGFDDTEPLRPASSLVLRVGDEDAEVQLGERCGADRAFELPRTFCGDQDGGIEEDAHLVGEDVGDLAGKPREIVVERLRRRRLPHSLQCGPTDPLVWARGPEAGDPTARDGDGELFAGLGPPQHLAHVVSQLLLRDGCHGRRVAILLPEGELAVEARSEHERRGDHLQEAQTSSSRRG